MKNIKILFYVFISIAYLFVSCNEKDEKVDLPNIYSFIDSKSTQDDNNADVAVDIQYNGPQQSAAVNVSFEVDASSSAVANVDYTLISTAVQIRANSSLGEIHYEALQLASGTEKKLIFKLLEGDFDFREDLNETHTITLKRPCCGI